MPKKKSPEDFFQRAREKGSGINKTIVNGAEVQKHLQPKTAKNYTRALDLWNGSILRPMLLRVFKEACLSDTPSHAQQIRIGSPWR